MTNYTVTGSTNYAAEVIQVKSIHALQGLDNLVGITAGGQQALVPKSTQVGDILVVFPAESQLSHDFASANDLYRHTELNVTPGTVGYLEDNRRVRAIRLRGEKSTALAMSLQSIHNWNDTRLGSNGVVDLPAVGTVFDTIDGIVISEKYELPVKGTGMAGKSAQEKAWKRVDEAYMPLHIDSENWWRNEHKISPDTIVTVSQKVHGTSVRIAHTIVKRKLTWKDRLAQRFGIKVAETEYAHVYGSRKVIKDPNNPNQDHFYKDENGKSFDLWSDFGKTIDHLIPQNVVVYGELIGWVNNGGPIQKGYTYNVPRGETHLYVYRVAVVSNDAHLYDLGWEAMEEFCRERGLNVVPLLWRGRKEDFVAEDWLDIKFYPTYTQAIPLAKESPCDEGVVVRAEGILPQAYKAKSPVFLAHETKILDEGTEILS